MKTFIINTDGASRGNPGKAAAAFIIKTSDGVIWAENGSFLGTATNNEAEYQAVILALEKLLTDFAAKLPAEVLIKADSQLIVNQLNGVFKIKNENLKKLYTQVKELEARVGQVKYQYVPRAENFLADKLANITLDKN